MQSWGSDLSLTSSFPDAECSHRTGQFNAFVHSIPLWASLLPVPYRYPTDTTSSLLLPWNKLWQKALLITPSSPPQLSRHRIPFPQLCVCCPAHFCCCGPLQAKQDRSLFNCNCNDYLVAPQSKIDISIWSHLYRWKKLYLCDLVRSSIDQPCPVPQITRCLMFPILFINLLIYLPIHLFVLFKHILSYSYPEKCYCWVFNILCFIQYRKYSSQLKDSYASQLKFDQELKSHFSKEAIQWIPWIATVCLNP